MTREQEMAQLPGKFKQYQQRKVPNNNRCHADAMELLMQACTSGCIVTANAHTLHLEKNPSCGRQTCASALTQSAPGPAKVLCTQT